MPSADVRALNALYDPRRRYANFGAVIRSMRISGFRGIADTTVSLASPITAFSGLNGTGKSTITQLAVCAYKRPTTAVNHSRFFVAQFFPVSVADPSPIAANARVAYTYETNQPESPREVTVSRAISAWSGYKRQPERYCHYIGLALYLPKVERRDLSIYRARNLELRGTGRELTAEGRQAVARILNQRYDNIRFQAVGHGDRESELGVAERRGHAYSENNMGFGEARALYVIDELEQAPNQSLFILEEPETSLHEDAQYRLGEYLVDVAIRKRHQILLSTHSSTILAALPPESRQFIHRDPNGIVMLPGISPARARAILSGGTQLALTVCVEDDFAKTVLQEIVRVVDPHLLRTIRIEPFGSSDVVRQAVGHLRQIGHNAIGVRDGDVGEAPANLLFSLPGTRAPEWEVYTNAAVQNALALSFGVDVLKTLAQLPDNDHHQITSRIAAEASASEDHIASSAAQRYAQSLEAEARDRLVARIRAHV